MEDQAPYLGGSGDLMDGREGMTPFDVLRLVFGNLLSPGELEDALGRNGWDLRVQWNTWLIVSSSNSANKSSEETEHYLHHLHHNYSIFPVAIMPLLQPDLDSPADLCRVSSSLAD